MNLVSTTKDALGIDPRTRDATKPSADNSSNDNNSPPFDGVLADVGSGAKSSDTPAQKADGAAATPTVDASFDTTILDALIGILGKEAGAATAAATTGGTDPKGDAQTGTSKGAGDSNDLVDSLLKKIASKDQVARDQAPQGAAATPSAIPTDVMAMLLMGAGVQPAMQASAAPNGAASGGNGSGTADSKGQTRAISADAAVTTAPQETIVSNLSVSTHLAPADNLRADVVSADARGAAATAVSAGAPSSAGSATHARPNDGALSLHGTEQSATAPALSPISTDFAPLRSIATAVGDLASSAPAAVTTPDTPKPTVLGLARTMTLQLNPADLGTVGIRMHITGQTLDVQLTISDPQTLGMVSRERDALATALHDQNYQLNSLVIQDGAAATSSGGNNAPTQGDTSGGNTRPDRQGDGAGSHSQPGGRQGQDPDRSARDDRQPSHDAIPRPPADPRGGSLFV